MALDVNVNTFLICPNELDKGMQARIEISKLSVNVTLFYVQFYQQINLYLIGR